MNNTMTVEQVAVRCHVKPRTVREWIKQGKLSAHRIGKQYLIEEMDLNRAVVHVGNRERKAAEIKQSIARMQGIFAGTGLSTQQFMEEKQEEIEREEQKFERRHKS